MSAGRRRPSGSTSSTRSEIRILASGNDASVFKGQTVRLLIDHGAGAAAREGRAIDRYMKAYRETVDFMYTDAGLKIYADWLQHPVEAKATAHARRLLPQGSGQSGPDHRP